MVLTPKLELVEQNFEVTLGPDETFKKRWLERRFGLFSDLWPEVLSHVEPVTGPKSVRLSSYNIKEAITDEELIAALPSVTFDISDMWIIHQLARGYMDGPYHETYMGGYNDFRIKIGPRVFQMHIEGHHGTTYLWERMIDPSGFCYSPCGSDSRIFTFEEVGVGGTNAGNTGKRLSLAEIIESGTPYHIQDQ